MLRTPYYRCSNGFVTGGPLGRRASLVCRQVKRTLESRAAVVVLAAAVRKYLGVVSSCVKRGQVVGTQVSAPQTPHFILDILENHC